MSTKNPMTLAGIEPTTFRFVAQHLNHIVISRAVRRPRHFGYSPPSGAEVKNECSYTSVFLICFNVVDRDNFLTRPLPRDSFCSISCSIYVPWY